MNNLEIDKAVSVRPGEDIDLEELNKLIGSKISFESIKEIKQFPGGYSNLTYQLKTDNNSYVLRKAPKGAKGIKGGHNLEREFNILKALLNANFKKIPEPILLLNENQENSLPFYMMQKVEGLILRANDATKIAKSYSVEQIKELSINLCNSLVELHSIDLEKSKLNTIGKPEGYIKRQVEGWWNRFENSKLETIPDLEFAYNWLIENLPIENSPCLIHNDFKYDNVVLNPNNPTEIIAILDWEMCTIGDPMMDLGTTLSYWTEKEDDDFLKSFNLSWLNGNLNKSEFANLYSKLSGRDVSNIVYYYVFGLFKNSIVILQIYARYKKGLSQDPRFEHLNFGVIKLAKKARKSIESNTMA